MAPRKSDSSSWKKGAKESLYVCRKPDGEPLLRFDIQAAVLKAIFDDRTFRFTAPVDRHAPPEDKVLYLNFDQLYLESILSSGKTSPALRTKLIENSAFADSFSKIALLVNIGRINTLLAFQANMKAAARTYHPVPSLQRDEMSRKEIQDAPRIKATLKHCFLDWEVAAPPTCLRDIAVKLASPELTRGPPTTVVGALFHLFNEATWVSEKYFPPGFDLLDIFYPTNEISSVSRAQAFLSLMHHVLEDKDFINDFSPNSPARVALNPPIVLARDRNRPPEDVDTPEELQYVKEMQSIRWEVVNSTPAIQKKREADELQAQLAALKKAALVDIPPTSAEPTTKRQRIGEEGPAQSLAKRHNAKIAAARPLEILPPGWENEDWDDDPKTSSLPLTWFKILRDVQQNRDPDYDSDEEEAWSYDLLRRRQLLTVVNPETGQRGPVTDIKEYAEWTRRHEGGMATQSVDQMPDEALGEIDEGEYSDSYD